MNIYVDIKREEEKVCQDARGVKKKSRKRLKSGVIPFSMSSFSAVQNAKRPSRLTIAKEN